MRVVRRHGQLNEFIGRESGKRSLLLKALTLKKVHVLTFGSPMTKVKSPNS